MQGRSLLIALVVSLTGVAHAGANDIQGTAHFVDGDSLRIGDTRIRLFGIDAPEADQTCQTEQRADWPCGQWVTTQTRNLFEGRNLRCAPLDIDRYDRVVARCFLGATDVAEMLVSDGLAFAYRRYSMDYDLAEKRAAVRDAGLHAMRVQSPSQFRQTRAPGRIPTDRSCAIKGNISSKGTRIYHMPGQRDYERTGIREDKGERWFCNEAAAQAAGWRPARR